MDIEPRYVDVAIRRWQAFTKKDAVDSESGCTFDQLEAERACAAGESDEAPKTAATDPEASVA
jgi:hypothetical protein